MNSSFSAQSDSAQRLQVEPRLIYALWNANAAYADCDAMLEIRTSFVGDGAEVKIKGKTDEGSSLGKLDAQIFGNRLLIGFPMPKKLAPDELAYVEVKLSKHKIEGESNRIPTRPAIVVRKMLWSAREVRRGDVLTITADFQSMIPDGTDALMIVYEFDPDGNHDPVAKIPATVQNNKIELAWEFQYHGDTNEIPTYDELQKYGKQYRAPEYFFVAVVDGQRIGVNQESGLLKFIDLIEIRVTDGYGIAMKDTDVLLHLPDGSQRTVRTDANGMIRDEHAAPGRVYIEIPD